MSQPNQSKSLLSEIGLSFCILSQFLEIKDKLRLAATSKLFRKIIISPNNWGEFKISDCQIKHQNWDNMLGWTQKYMPQIRPKQINIVVFDHAQDKNLLNLFLVDLFYVQKLTICCQSTDLHLLLSKTCSQVTHLSARSNVFSNAIFEYMCQSMTKIIDFQVVKDDLQFTCQNISNYFSNQIERLVLKPHLVVFQQLSKFLEKCGKNLVQLQIDVEQCSEQTLIQILKTLNSIQILRIYHVQHIQIPELLSKVLSPKMREFGLSKAYKMPMDMIMNKITSKNLIAIDFTEIIMLTESQLKLVSDRCPYLKKLNISWCINLNEAGISQLIKKCKLLQHLNVTGLKNLTQNAFSDYCEFLPTFNQAEYDRLKQAITKKRMKKQQISQNSKQTSNSDQFLDSNQQFFKYYKQSQFQQISTLRNLRELIAISCNSISDKILKIIYCVNRKVNVVNYYTNPLGLYSKDQLQDDYY